MWLRDWQQRGCDKIDRLIQKDEKSTIVTIDACVGSGKTAVMFEAINSYIKHFSDRKTLHIFVTPRISLCQQQLESYISDYTDFIDKNKVEVIEWNCKSSEHIDKVSDRINLITEMPQNRESVLGNTEPNHFVIFIVCESLWGADKHKRSRYETEVSNFLDYAETQGIDLGLILYDEAHNYSNNQKQMFGKQYALEA